MILANTGSGLYAFRKELLQELVKEDELYVSIPDHINEKELLELGAKMESVRFDRRGMNPVKDLKLIFAYKKLLSRLKPDVVLTYTIKPNIYGGMMCQWLRIPYIINVTGLGTAVNGGGILSKTLKVLYRYAMAKAKVVFFQNKRNMEILAEPSHQVGNCALLPGSGVNLQENCFEKYPEEDGSLRFMMVGRVMRDKGIEEYLQCAQVIREKYPYTSFDVIGGYDDTSYEEKIRELSEAGTICYLGSRDDVHDLMKAHHAVIHPSYHEGLSNVLLEAAACGRPLIATNVSGCKETYEDGVSGIGFDARNAQALIDAVEKFIAMPYAEKEKMGIAGRQKVEREFDRNIVVNAYLKAIEE